MVALVSGARTLGLPGSVHAAWSDASRGDLRPGGRAHAGGAPDGAALSAFAGEVTAATGAPVGAVCWTDQVHGSRVLDVATAPVPAPDGPAPPLVCSGEGDALVSDLPGVALCVLTADCGALALASPEGVYAAVHVGWRGLVAGVVEAAVDRMRGRGATEVVGALGPCIHAECYEFSGADLDAVAAVYGDAVRGRTTGGRPALDVPAGIAAALARAGARSVRGVDACTACDDGYHSHRARHDTGRQALLVWSAPSAGSGP
ncbi:MAG TPA: laccase domain-containing protein [Acidimicrobiales bacterium]|nr:laccase domain-containing protein [Acidimicrobiales bacterium]